MTFNQQYFGHPSFCVQDWSRKRTTDKARLAYTRTPARTTSVSKLNGTPATAPLKKDPWLFDTTVLLRELDRIRELVLHIPLSLETHFATQTVVNALWFLEEDLRYLEHLNRSTGHNSRT